MLDIERFLNLWLAKDHLTFTIEQSGDRGWRGSVEPLFAAIMAWLPKLDAHAKEHAR